jgi:hypothetical protein
MCLLSGEVSNLYSTAEAYEKVIQGTQSSARDAGISDEDRDGIFSFFTSRVRRNLHLVLCMSPVGNSFRLVVGISEPHCLIKSTESELIFQINDTAQEFSCDEYVVMFCCMLSLFHCFSCFGPTWNCIVFPSDNK